ncbi:MAG: hypothetical protein V4502_13235 [Pseudomonadota bacterium]
MTEPALSAELATEEELVIELAALTARRGDQQHVAQMLGISQGLLSNILTNGRGVGPRAANALGYRKVVRFERIS